MIIRMPDEKPISGPDGSERVRSEAASQLHNAIVATMAEGVCLVRVRDETIVYANPRFEQMFGYGPGEMNGLPVARVNYETDAQAAAATARRIIAELERSGEAVYEMQNLRKDGTPFWSRVHTCTLDHPEHGHVWIGVHEDITERKQAENALRESEDRFRNLYNNAVIGFYRTTPDGRILMANPAVLQLTGYDSLSDLTERNLETNGFHPDYPRALFKERLKKEGEIRGFESAWVRRDGKTIYVRENCRAVTDRAGQVLYYDGSVEDITERRNVEEALRQSEERLNFALQASHTGTWSFDFRDHTATRTLIHAQIFGYATADGAWTLDHFFEHIIPEDRERMRQVVHSALSAQKEWQAECRIRRVDGEHRWIFVAGGFEHNAAGPSPRVSGIVQDITERKRVEGRDRRRARALELMATGDPLPEILTAIVLALEADEPSGLCSILLLDETGHYLLHGAAPSLPPFFSQAIHGMAIGDGRGSCGTAAYARQRVLVEDIQTHPYWIHFRELAQQAGLRACWSEPILASHGHALGTFAIYHREPRAPTAEDLQHIKDAADLASLAIERERSAQEIRRLNTSLEQRVQERTAELRASLEELDAFAYAVSHDLRAPLRAMSGFGLALAEDFGHLLPADAHAYLEQIQTGSREMGNLIDGLLRLSRSTRGQLQREMVDLSAMATQILVKLQAAEPQRELKWNVEPNLSVNGDARLLEIVLTNLLGNAWKYTVHTPQPLIRVFAQVDALVPTICVADNGAGFDMKHAAKLFVPFQRLHREDEFPGIGIGLATVQRIIRRHGGTIQATGAPGAGATFRFSLPKFDQQIST